MADMKKINSEQLRGMGIQISGPVCVDLGCGTRKRDGYIGVDSAGLPGVDIVCNLEEGLPFEDGVVDKIWANFLFEHVKNTIFLFQELHRVCKNGAIIEYRVPYYQSITQYKDPTHQAIITPEMMRYFSDDLWYGSDYGIHTNFKLMEVTYHYLPPFSLLFGEKYRFLRRIAQIVCHPFLLFARRFLWNVVHSITITVKVIK